MNNSKTKGLIENLSISAPIKRFIAYLIDYAPILVIVFCIAYFSGFKEVLRQFLSESPFVYTDDYIIWKNHIQNISFLLYCIYASFMECTSHQGTFGKKIMGIKVVGLDGEKLSPIGSVKRNMFKFISYLPYSLGFIWALFDRNHRAWHDYFAKTIVVNRHVGSGG